MSLTVKAIIFDCFGVILTDALSVLVAELEAQQPEKVPEMRAIIRAANKGIIDPAESTERVAEMLGVSVSEYRQRISNGEVKNQALLDYVSELRPHYKTAMLSNITLQGIERRFPDNELDQYFDAVVISSVIGYVKPDLEAYTITAERLGVKPEESVFTDDRPDYCDAARMVGMQAIVFKSLPQFQRELVQLLR